MDKKSQKENIIKKYTADAPLYDTEIVPKSDYSMPAVIQDFYRQHSVKRGLLLDTGCGTGALREVLGDNFEYWGIDISSGMTEIAKKRYQKVWTGDALFIIKEFKDKSVDHITAISWLAFLSEGEFDEFLKECHRVARETIFISCDLAPRGIEELFKSDGIILTRHTPKIPATDSKITHTWTHRIKGISVEAGCYFYDLREKKISIGMNKLKLIYPILAMVFGVFMFVYGKYDDSPGGQLFGILMFILGIFVVVKSMKKILIN